MGLQLPLGAAAGGVSARMWAAFVELNHLLAGHPHAIRGNSISFRSVPRTGRHELWTRYARTQGLSAEAARAAAAGAAAPLPGWLGLALAVIGSCLNGYPDASATEYEVHMPGYMLAWAARWGVGDSSGATIKLLQVEAFSGSSGGMSGSQRPAQSLYLPVGM